VEIGWAQVIVSGSDLLEDDARNRPTRSTCVFYMHGFLTRSVVRGQVVSKDTVTDTCHMAEGGSKY
jgi:hypothetical protein